MDRCGDLMICMLSNSSWRTAYCILQLQKMYSSHRRDWNFPGGGVGAGAVCKTVLQVARISLKLA